MNKTLLIVFLLISGLANAQKVKIEKGIISIDRKAFLKYNDTSERISLQLLDGKAFAVIKSYTFEASENKISENPNDRNYSQSAPIDYFVVSFTEFDLEFETDMTLNKLYAAFYKYGLTEQGVVSQKNATRIGAKISEEISGERPAIKITN